MAPIDLPKGQTLLCITKFVNPSTQAWLEPSLRAELRDEFTRRGQVRWVSRNKAETLVTIRVIRYSSSSTLKGADDETVTSAIQLDLAVDMYNAADRSVIWTSGTVRASQSFKGESNKQKAREDAVSLATERIADRLGQAF
ncbi:LPS assembly lipoprotein LptE [Desulfoplanes sp.]